MRDGKTEILELVPHEHFHNDLPTFYVEEHTHWMNLHTGVVELRPLSSKWQSSSCNWNIDFSTPLASHMQLASTFLVDITSPSCDMIFGAFKALEPRERIHIFHQEGKNLLSVHLPRFKLDFFIDAEGQLESRQFRELVVDLNQDIGTFYGLRSRLLLRHRSPQRNIRTVLIPYGALQFDFHREHIAVDIKTDNQSRVRFYRYHLDHTLHKLVSGSEQSSMYFQAYLHAITSYCTPDPLTGKTGTEEALDILRSAGAFSFQKLDAMTLRILELIAKLSPQRTFYPTNLQVMQRVEWSQLTSLVQHDLFQELVASIVAYSSKMDAFQGQDIPIWKGRKTAKLLLDRSLINNSFVRTESYRGRLSGRDEDRIYERARDVKPLIQEANVFRISGLICGEKPALNVIPNLFQVLQRQESILGVDADPFAYCNHREWLERCENDLAKEWIPFFIWCRRHFLCPNKYELLFVLSGMTYAGIDERLIQSLLAFAKTPSFQTIQPPPYDSYELSYGYQPSMHDISKILHSQCTLPFERSSEYRTWHRLEEHLINDRADAASKWKVRLSSQIDTLTSYLISQWPCEKLTMPPWTDETYDLILLTNANAIEQLSNHFKHWFRNKGLNEHISQVQMMLDNLDRVQQRTPAVLDFNPCHIAPSLKPSLITIRDILQINVPDPLDLQYRPREGLELVEVRTINLSLVGSS